MPNPRGFRAEFLRRSCAKFNEILQAEPGAPKPEQSKPSALKPGRDKLAATCKQNLSPPKPAPKFYRPSAEFSALVLSA